jgi:hypothetical protein
MVLGPCLRRHACCVFELQTCVKWYCDTKAESRNNLKDKSSIARNGSLTHVSAATDTKLTYVSMEAWIPRNQLGVKRVFHVNGQATNIFHGDRRLRGYKRPCRQARGIRKSDCSRDWVFICGVLTSGQRKLKKSPARKSESSQSQGRRRRSKSRKEESES